MKPRTVFALIGLFLAATVLLVVALTNSTTNVMDLTVGQCFNADFESDEVHNVERVDCAKPHLAEVIVRGELNPGRNRDYPADAELSREADAGCVSAEGLITDRFAIVPIPSNEAAWTPLAGRYLCVALAYGLVPTTGSAMS